MTIDELYLLVAEIRCSHGRLVLGDAECADEDWTVYLHEAARPGACRVRDFHAYQAYAPILPASWIVGGAPVEREGQDDEAVVGALTLPDIAQILASATVDRPWQLRAIRRTSGGGDTYRVEAQDPRTDEARVFATLAAYQQASREGAGINVLPAEPAEERQPVSAPPPSLAVGNGQLHLSPPHERFPE